MNPWLARLLVGLYPRAWKNRYGDEFVAMLEEGRGGIAAVCNVLRAALGERMVPTVVAATPLPTVPTVVVDPTAFLPLAMSLTALAVVLGHIALYGHAREADEGATAHIWQLLMGGQIPLVMFFAARWLPRAPRPTLCVLALQAGALLASMAPVFYFHL